MRKSIALGALSMVLFFCAISSDGLAATYQIDPAHSSVEFKIKHIVGKVSGYFKNFSGTIEFDENKIAESTVHAAVDVGSIDTRIEKRDKHLRNPDFFDVMKFPEATFVSKRVDAEAKKLVGDLTIHGITREVSLDYTFDGLADDPQGKKRLGGSGRMVLDRRDFGINYDPTGLSVGFEATVQLEIEAVLKEN